MADVLSGGRKDFNEPQTVAGHVVVPVGVLLSVGDEEAAADVLNIEGREAARDVPRTAVVTAVIVIAVGIECIVAKVHGLEIGVVDFDARLAEIGDVKEAVSIDLTARHALIDGSIPGAFISVIHFQHGVDRRGLAARGNVHGGIPARNRSVLGGENKHSWFSCRRALAEQKIGRAAVEYDTSWSGLRSRRCEARWWNDDEVSGDTAGLGEDVAGAPVAAEEARGPGVVIADPPGAARAAGKSPGILQVGVNRGGHANVGNEVGLFVMLCLYERREEEKRKTKYRERLPIFCCG